MFANVRRCPLIGCAPIEYSTSGRARTIAKIREILGWFGYAFGYGTPKPYLCDPMKTKTLLDSLGDQLVVVEPAADRVPFDGAVDA